MHTAILKYISSVNTLESWYTQLRQTQNSVLGQPLNVTGCCTVTTTWCGEAPTFSAPPVTHLELKRSEVRSFVTSIKQTGRGPSESHPQGRAGVGFVLCLVIVSVSPTTFRRQQQADKQIERLFDAGALFLCDTLTPSLLHGPGGEYHRE